MMVSIILPTYNGVSRIRKAIDSVIAQTFIEWELIVVDDGSAQDIKTVLPNDARIRYIKNQTNLGIQKTLNRGLAEAKGKYIARIDDDDVWSDRTKLQEQVAFLESHPDHVLVGTGAVLLDEASKELGRYLLPQSDTYIRAHMLRKNYFVHSSVLFRNLGLRYTEDAHMRHVEDYELWLQLGRKGKLANLLTHGVMLSVRATTLTATHRVAQAMGALRLAWRFRRVYPGFVMGFLVASARLMFFVVQRSIPISPRLVYWIQSKQKSM